MLEVYQCATVIDRWPRTKFAIFAAHCCVWGCPGAQQFQRLGPIERPSQREERAGSKFARSRWLAARAFWPSATVICLPCAIPLPARTPLERVNCSSRRAGAWCDGRADGRCRAAAGSDGPRQRAPSQLTVHRCCPLCFCLDVIAPSSPGQRASVAGSPSPADPPLAMCGAPAHSARGECASWGHTCMVLPTV